MAKFIEGPELFSEIGKILKGAEKHLILISPYIKLDAHYDSILRSKLENPYL